MKSPLPASVEQRALEFIDQGMEIMDAVKAAFEAEEKFIASLLGSNGLSKTGEQVAEVLSERVYHKIRSSGSKAEVAYNPRYVEYAKSKGMTPEQALDSDGSMMEFLLWRPSEHNTIRRDE